MEYASQGALRHRELGLILLVTGFAAGILTDLVVAYGGV
jgi:hypothetical protein